MKRTMFFIAAILLATVTYAQDAEKARWSPEFSAKAYLSVAHGSYEFTAGANINDNVFGLGSGYGMEFWSAYPAHVKKVPMYGFYRRYIPLGEKKRFLLFGEITLGGDYVHKISGTNKEGGEIKHTPYWIGKSCISPGIALRLFGKTNIYLAPTFEVRIPQETMFGLTAGLNVGL